MEKIFTYGTLQNPDIQIDVLGRKLSDGTPDTLRGYAMGKLQGIHMIYNIIYPKTGSTVQGTVYDVTNEEFEKLDAYEGNAYLRVSATLVSNTRAWIYRDNPDSIYQSQIVKADD